MTDTSGPEPSIGTESISPGSDDTTDSAPAPRRQRLTKGQRSILEWVIVIGGAIVVVLVVRAFLFQAFYIPSGSMEPTLKINDRVIVNKLSYKFHDVNRGDIVVFDRPTCKGSDVPGWATCAESDKIKDLIKRVIALPGDTIELRDGRVWINGRELSESYVHGQTTDPICAFPSNPAKYTVPKGDVFVMGDNRHNSTDSRCFGPIHTSRIVGRAFIRVWPLGRVAFL